MEDCAYATESGEESDEFNDIEEVPVPRKRSVTVTEEDDLSSGKRSKNSARMVKKRGVTITTVEKWKRDYDKLLNTCVWLEYDKMDREYVSVLKCKVCKQFSDKIQSARNFNPAFINRSKNLRASAMKDHGKTDMHQMAMRLFNKCSAEDITDYAPIAKALCTMDKTSKEVLQKKFEIAYFICKENLAFTKMAPLCELQAKHGIHLGTGYKNNQACSVFIEYIAKEQRVLLNEKLKNAKYYSIQADGSTDCANKEEELFLVLYFDPYTDDGKVHVRNKFFAVRQPKNGTAAGLYESLVRAFNHVDVNDWKDKLIGFGCDGTSVNIAGNGLKGYLEQSCPWIVTFWCLAHRLELSIKDALKSTYFSTIDDVLMRLYYLYENSAKKCRELDDVVQYLKLCFTEPESRLSATRGNKPLRACGTRFIAHKVAAINRLLDKYGAYIAHLITLIEDPSVRQTDKQKLKGYLLKWKESKVLMGCSFFHDLLKPCAILSKVLQDDELCITEAIEAVLKTNKNIDNSKATNFDDLPTVKNIMSRIQDTNDGATYQGVQITHYKEAVSFFRSHKEELIKLVAECLKDRIKAQHTEVLTDVLTLLATHGWGRSEDLEFASVPINNLAYHFKTPLEKSGVDVSALEEEWIDLLDYSRKYLNIAQDKSLTIWWKLFNAPSSKNWTNILNLIELLFCSNGHVERVFSTLKLVKSDRRNCLSEQHLDDVLRIMVEAPPLSQWDSSRAVQLWWRDKQRRSVSDTRKAPKKKKRQK